MIIFHVDDTWGKVRAMISYEGRMLDKAFPSMPVEILGMNSSAYAGAEFIVTKDEDEAKKIAEQRKTILQKQNSVKRQNYSF